MKRLLLVFIPAALFGQVVVDTVIRLPPPTYLLKGLYTPELNKLHIHTGNFHITVVDCSSYQARAEIPYPWDQGMARFAWNWRRQKLYFQVYPVPYANTLVIDAIADTVVESLPLRSGGYTYASDLDRLYVPNGDTLDVYDCATDTVVRRIPCPLQGYVFHWASWDSVGRKLYVSVGPSHLAVYDHLADSFTKVIDVSSVAVRPNSLVFSHARRKAYFGPSAPPPYDGHVGILDTEHDTLLRVLPLTVTNGVTNPIAVNERDGKVYIAADDADRDTPDTLWVVDCATDSVLKKIVYARRGWGAWWVRWVPWSNRIYLDYDLDHSVQTLDSCIVVLDCNTDSIIVPGLALGYFASSGIEIDPIRERIFVVGAESATVHVLRDSGYEGVADAKPARPGLAAGLQVRMSAGGFDVRYSIASRCHVDLLVYDLMGREVRQLVSEEQSPGQHSAVWNGTDRNGAILARGVYFIRLDSPAFTDVKKAVVTR